MNASQIQSKINLFCKEQGVYYNKIISASFNGLPDVMVVIDGTTYWFEVKAKDTKDRIRPEQAATISRLNQNKDIAFVVRTFEEFRDIYSTLTTIKESKPKQIIWRLE